MITPREPDKDGKCVDLTRFYTGSLLQLLKSEPDNSIPITPGFHTLGGVTYDIRGVVALRSALVSFLPRSAKEIPVHRICKRLHFLHGSGWDVPRGTCVATLIVHYKDGRKEEMPLRYGAETANWWVRTGQSPPGVEVVWTGVNPRAERAGLSCALFHTAWENPRPNMEVDIVDCVSSMTPGLPFLVALTID